MIRGRAPRARAASFPAAALLVAAAFAPPAAAALLGVAPGDGTLAAAVAAAAPGDTLLLEPGIHRGGASIDRRLAIRGAPDAVIEGTGNGSVLLVGASGVSIADVAIRRGGSRALSIDAGIHVLDAAGVRIERVRMTDVLYGVAAERSDSLLIAGCVLVGRARPTEGVQTGADASEGNGIHLWYSQDATVRDCRVTRFVDGIYLSFAFRARIEGNLLADNARYGLHTMYNQENRLVQNRFTRNVAGCALMFSNHLLVEGNDFVLNRGSRTYGLLLRDCSDGVFTRNRMAGNTIAVFLDGSNRNRFRENLVQDNGWGILLFSSCDENEFARNNFWNNDYPVALDMRRSDNRFDDGHVGNFWSGNGAYDLDGDGVSDVPYSPVSAFAFLSKQFPDLAVFGESPAAAALAMAERTIPALRPSEIVDRFPLAAPAPAAPRLLPPEPVPPSQARGRAVAAGAFGLLALVGLAGVGATLRAR